MTTADASNQGGAAGGQVANAGQSTAVDYKFDPIDGIQLAPEFDADIVTVAKAMGWDQATATKFRAFEAKSAHEAMLADKKHAETAAAQAKLAKEQEIAQRKTDWEKANRDHKDYGGQKYAETSERVKQLVARFDRDQVFTKGLLTESPDLLDHPQIRGLLASIAYAMADGKFHEGTTAAQPVADKHLFYGKTG